MQQTCKSKLTEIDDEGFMKVKVKEKLKKENVYFIPTVQSLKFSVFLINFVIIGSWDNSHIFFTYNSQNI